MQKSWKDYLYYFIIGIVSAILIIFIPMIGSSVNGGLALPTNTADWLIWWVIKLGSAVLNVLIFHCFMQQALLNSQENENYKRANELLGKIKNLKWKPRSPKKFNAKEYGIKGVTIFIATAVSTIAITSAVLKYNYMILIAYLVTLTLGIVFGIMSQKTAERYWTVEYLQYAEYCIDEQNKAKIQLGKEINQCLQSMEKNLETWKSK